MPDRGDRWHAWAVERWSHLFEPLWTCEAVLSEAIFLLQSEGSSADPVLQLIERGIVCLDFSMEAHRPDVSRLMRKYADQPISVGDACLVRMAEVAEACQVFTTDRHFRVYRRRGRHLDVNEMILTLQGENLRVERYQMAGSPNAFLGNTEVMKLVREKQMEALPITVVRGKVRKVGAYATLAEMREFLSRATK